MSNWIKSPEATPAGAVTFSKKWSPRGAVAHAEVCASAIGIYAFYFNKQRVGERVLAPGWTTYTKRVQYQSYDVTALIQNENTFEFGVGRGWAVGFIGYNNTDCYYSDHTALWVKINITYADGSSEEIIGGSDWEVYTSQVLMSEIYLGETVDLTAPITLIGNAVKTDFGCEVIEQVGEDIIENERLAPIELIRTPKGELLVDFGQNMTGYVELRIKAPRGSRIVIRHAEVLDSDGNFYNENYRAARSENTYICSGGEDVFKPTYSFQGFRYIRLDEFPDIEIKPEQFRAIAVHSRLERTGEYVCGNEKINQLYHNIIWGQKSNYLDIPTDCPQRDERLGWTGDAQVFFRTAAINFNVKKFFKKWMGEVAIEQTPEGAVYGIVPSCMHEPNFTRISAAWGDAACIIPWGLYMAYGDKEMLEEHFPVMKKWVDYLHSQGSEEFLWLGGTHYGDWIATDNEPDPYGKTPPDFIASAYFAYSTSLLVKAGRELGYDMNEYELLCENVKDAIRTKLTPICDSQTAHALMLYFNICKEEERGAYTKRLAELVRENGMRISTGFVGTPYILHALSENGCIDLAYELLLQEKHPSWLYSVNRGATTMWERWGGIKEDGTFWNPGMNSFNHYAYGAVFDWMFGVSSGIVPTKPGYSEISLTPHPDKRLGFAKASIKTAHGVISSHWVYKGDKVYYTFEIPQGVTARLTLPSGYSETLVGGTYKFAN